MGQYYAAVVRDGDNVHIYTHTDSDEKYRTLGKLMEHSYWYNPFVCSLSRILYEQGEFRLLWLGDYASERDPKYQELVEKAFSSESPTKKESVPHDELTLDGKFLCNHTKKLYMDCDAYKKNSTNSIIHPLPLLTAVGNGLGGGDYHGTYMEAVGSWADDVLEIMDSKPDGYKQLHAVFAESY